MQVEARIADRYRLVRRLGVGGMGEVYLAADSADGDRHVALKRLRPGRIVGERAIELFLNEARLQARLRHPNVVRVHAHGMDSGLPWMAPKLVAGRDLKQIVQRAAETTCPE